MREGVAKICRVSLFGGSVSAKYAARASWDTWQLSICPDSPTKHELKAIERSCSTSEAENRFARGGRNLLLYTGWQEYSTLHGVAGITSSPCHRYPTLLVTTLLQPSSALFYIFTALLQCLSALQIVSTFPSTLLHCQHSPDYKLSAREEGGDRLVQETDD